MRLSFIPRPLAPDIKLFLALIPLINAYNYYLTYTGIQLNWFLLYTYGLDTLQGYAAWWAMRRFIDWLNGHLAYEPIPARRIMVQGLGSVALGLAVIIGSTLLLNALLRDAPVPRSFYQYDIFIFVVWFLVINGFYVGFHYYQAWQQAASQAAVPMPPSVEQPPGEAPQLGVRVRAGRADELIDHGAIQGFYVDGDYAVLVTKTGKKYLLDQSLDKLEAQLPPAVFFRVNRRLILSRQVVGGFQRVENGKLLVQVLAVGPLAEAGQVSRAKAAAFKSWFAQR